MEQTLLIDGGLGRVICAIPALEKFIEAHEQDNIICYFWTPIIWGNKLLTPRTFDNQTKGLLERIRHTKISRPEPYYNNDYINENCNLIQAFHQEINQLTEILEPAKLYLSRQELLINSKVRSDKTKKVIALQPFGSGAQITADNVLDTSARSLNRLTLQMLIRRLRQENYDIYLITDKPIPFVNSEDFIKHQPKQIRDIAASIAHCDYFVGIDSAGQHIARCLDKPGSVIMGATSAVNTSYPDYFNIIETNTEKTYMSYRLCEFDFWLAEIENSEILNLNKDQARIICDNVIDHIKKTT